MSDPARAYATVASLRDMGVGVSTDDFGTSNSPLAYLKQLPVDAHNLGLAVVAERVEDESTRKLLRQVGCGQGARLVISQPLGAAELTRWLM
jgi:EAL domain-containing protein (putative c-di-GMP-specific phosphodiesterase class I)